MEKANMKECLNCGKQFDASKRTTTQWKRLYDSLGAVADMCYECWKTEYGRDVHKIDAED